MEHNEDRDSLKNIPTFILPPPPRFDAAASAAARPVEPLEKTRIKIGLPLRPKLSRLINRRSRFLALMAIVGLATGAAGGILVVERDKQQRVESSASMIQVSDEQTATFDSAAPALENTDSSLEVAEPVENTVRTRRNQRRPRKRPASELVVVSNADEGEDENPDRDKDDDEDDNDSDRQKDRERDRKSQGRDRDADSDRNDRSRRGSALLYDSSAPGSHSHNPVTKFAQRSRCARGRCRARNLPHSDLQFLVVTSLLGGRSSFISLDGALWIVSSCETFDLLPTHEREDMVH